MAAKQMEEAIGNVPGLARDIAASEFDVVVCASPESVLYTSDVFVSSQIDIRDRLTLIAWDGSRQPTFVVCQVEEVYVRQESWIDDIRTFKEFVTSPIDVLADVLTEMGAERALVGGEGR